MGTNPKHYYATDGWFSIEEAIVLGAIASAAVWLMFWPDSAIRLFLAAFGV